MRKFLIGIVVFVVLAGLGLWWAGTKGLLPGYAQLRSYTDDASGLTDGTRVRLNGIPIGYLDHQVLTGSQNQKRRVQFDMKVKSSYLSKIPVDSAVGIVADNLLSDKSIDIVPGTSQEYVQSGAELRSVLAIDPNGLMAQAATDLQSLQDVLKHVDVILSSVDAGTGSAGKLKKAWESKYSGLSDQSQKLAKDFDNARGTYYKVFVDNRELKADVQNASDRLDDLMNSFQTGEGTAGKLQNLSKDIEETNQEIQKVQAAIASHSTDFDELEKKLDGLTAKVKGMIDKVNAGQGTLGQFTINPQLSEAFAGLGREMEGISKELQANPKKFFTIHFAVF